MHWSQLYTCRGVHIGRKKAKAQSKVIDLRDPRVREEFLIGEMTAANQKMMEGMLTTRSSVTACCTICCPQGTLRRQLDTF